MIRAQFYLKIRIWLDLLTRLCDYTVTACIASHQIASLTYQCKGGKHNSGAMHFDLILNRLFAVVGVDTHDCRG